MSLHETELGKDIQRLTISRHFKKAYLPAFMTKYGVTADQADEAVRIGTTESVDRAQAYINSVAAGR
jgi:hypothetical protein